MSELVLQAGVMEELCSKTRGTSLSTLQASTCLPQFLIL